MVWIARPYIVQLEDDGLSRKGGNGNARDERQETFGDARSMMLGGDGWGALSRARHRHYFHARPL